MQLWNKSSKIIYETTFVLRDEQVLCPDVVISTTLHVSCPSQTTYTKRCMPEKKRVMVRKTFRTTRRSMYNHVVSCTTYPGNISLMLIMSLNTHNYMYSNLQTFLPTIERYIDRICGIHVKATTQWMWTSGERILNESS